MQWDNWNDISLNSYWTHDNEFMHTKTCW